MNTIANRVKIERRMIEDCTNCILAISMFKFMCEHGHVENLELTS